MAKMGYDLFESKILALKVTSGHGMGKRLARPTKGM